MTQRRAPYHTTGDCDASGVIDWANALAASLDENRRLRQEIERLRRERLVWAALALVLMEGEA